MHICIYRYTISRTIYRLIDAVQAKLDAYARKGMSGTDNLYIYIYIYVYIYR